MPVASRLAGVVAVIAAVVGVWSSTASAHVTITTYGTVTQGADDAEIGFSVPNERDNAGTVKLAVQLPKDHPFAGVSVQPMAGWDVTTTTRKLTTPVSGDNGSITDVVDTITWTAAAGTQIAPGQFQLFWISVGPIPTGVDSLTFPAVQTYSTGEQVAWIETSTPGGPEPEHPAPSISLAPAGAGGDSATATTAPGSGSTGATATTVVPAAAGSSSDTSSGGGSDTLAIIALIVGGAGFVAAIAALVITRRKPTATPSPS